MRKIIKSVIVANGRFPEGKIPLGYLNSASIIICCDGAVEKLLDYGCEPTAIVGDMDSITAKLKEKYRDIVMADSEDQDSNDLTKAIKYCIENDIMDATILGATGLREDHTVGNISLLFEYSEYINVRMVSDTSIIIPLQSSAEITSWPGQQISVVPDSPDMEILSAGLRYPLEGVRFTNWWKGTLNEATKDKIKLDFRTGKVLVFLNF